MSKRVSARAPVVYRETINSYIQDGIAHNDPGVREMVLNLRAKAVVEAYSEYLKGNVGELAQSMANLERALIQ